MAEDTSSAANVLGGTDLDFNKKTLTFNSPESERAFLKNRHHKLRSRVSLALSLLLLYLALAAALVRLGEGAYVDTADGHLVSQVREALWVAQAVLAVGWIFVSCPCVDWNWSPQIYEIATACLAATVPIFIASQDPWYLAELCGFSGDKLLRTTSTDYELLLWIDIYVTGCHFMLPFRWKVLFPLEAVSFLSYLVPACWGGRHDMYYVAMAAILFFILVLSEAVGKRDLEVQERTAFAQLAQERVWRASAEHRLYETAKEGIDWSRGAKDENSNEESRFHQSSCPETTQSGKVFGALDQEDHMSTAKQLEEVMKLGQNEHWLVQHKDLRPVPDSVLGAGGCGVVTLALFHGAPVVVKMPRRCPAGSDPARLLTIAQELRIFRRLRHPNIALFFGAAVDPVNQNIILILEHVRGSDLSQTVGGPCNTIAACEFRCRLINDVCCALSYLHAQKPEVIHGDLKHSNVMVERQGPSTYRAKLLDFGLSRLLTPRAQELGGTTRWCAPEVICQKEGALALSADIFSLGRLIFYILAGERPLDSLSAEAIQNLALDGRCPPLLWPQPVLLRKPASRLVRGCTSVVPAKRPTIDHVQAALRQWTAEAGSPELIFVLTRVFCSAQSADGASGVGQLLPPGPGTGATAETDGGTPSRSDELPKQQLLFPGFEETPAWTRFQALGTALAAWNVRRERGSCCDYHALVHVAQESLHTLICERCTEVAGKNVWQCFHCKCIGVVGTSVCTLCGRSHRGDAGRTSL